MYRLLKVFCTQHLLPNTSVRSGSVYSTKILRWVFFSLLEHTFCNYSLRTSFPVARLRRRQMTPHRTFKWHAHHEDVPSPPTINPHPSKKMKKLGSFEHTELTNLMVRLLSTFFFFANATTLCFSPIVGDIIVYYSFLTVFINKFNLVKLANILFSFLQKWKKKKREQQKLTPVITTLLQFISWHLSNQILCCTRLVILGTQWQSNLFTMVAIYSADFSLAQG